MSAPRLACAAGLAIVLSACTTPATAPQSDEADAAAGVAGHQPGIVNLAPEVCSPVLRDELDSISERLGALEERMEAGDVLEFVDALRRRGFEVIRIEERTGAPTLLQLHDGSLIVRLDPGNGVVDHRRHMSRLLDQIDDFGRRSMVVRSFRYEAGADSERRRFDRGRLVVDVR